MSRIFCVALLLLASFNDCVAGTDSNASFPLNITVTANPTTAGYASVAMYRWDANLQAGVLVETFSIPGLPSIPVDPPGSGGGGIIIPNSAGGSDRNGAIQLRATTRFPRIIVRGHPLWFGIGRLGVTLIDSYERIQAVRESNAVQCLDGQRRLDRFQCDVDDGDPAPTGCGSAPNGFVGDTVPAASQIFANACTIHSSCIRRLGASIASCASTLGYEMDRLCDAFYPIEGIPGSTIPVATYRNLNGGCHLQTDVYVMAGWSATIVDTAIAALRAWVQTFRGGDLGAWAQGDNLPTGPAAYAEAQRQTKCKDARDIVNQFCRE